MRACAALLALALLTAADWAVSPGPVPGQGARTQEGFAREVIAALGAEDDDRLDRQVELAPYRARQLVHDLLHQAADTHPEPWPLASARKIAGAVERVTGSGTTLAVVDDFDETRESWKALRELMLRSISRADAGYLGEAETLVREARELVRSKLFEALEPAPTRLLAQFLRDQDRLAEALEELSRAVAIGERTESWFHLADDLRLTGDLEFRLGRYAPAAQSYERSLELTERTGEGPRVDQATLAALYANLARYEEARRCIENAMAEQPDEARRAYLLGVASALESTTGNYREALRLRREALDLAARSGNPLAEANACVQLGGVLAEVGRFADAEDVLARALELTQPYQASTQFAYALSAVGLTRVDSGRPAEAIESLERARELFGDLGDGAGASAALHTLARGFLDSGRAEEARDAFREARTLRELAGDRFGAALSSCGLGRALEACGESEDRKAAEAAFGIALSSMGDLDLPEVSWRAWAGLARVAEADERFEDALRFSTAAIADVERMRRLLGSPALRERFLDDKLEVYRRAARLLARAGRLEEAFRWSGAVKARTLLELFLAARDEGASDTGPELEELRAAEAELLHLELGLSTALEVQSDEATRVDLERRLKAARLRHTQARIGLELADPLGSTLAGLSGPQSLKRVQSRLDPGEALVSYLVGPGGCAAWVVRAESAHHVELEVGAADLDASVAELFQPVELLHEGRTDISNLVFETRAAQDLDAALIEPLREHLTGVDALWIVPDGTLWRLPFALLVREREKRRVDPARLYAQYTGCRFLIEEFALGYLPAASLLMIEGNRSDGTPGPVIAVGDPYPLPGDAPRLPAARTEAAAVCARFGDARLLVAGDAGEGRVKAIAAGASTLHFAVHGLLDDRRPAYSRLALAPDAGEDGWLHAFEVEGLSLAGPRVVLSACRSAGAATGGEGLLGLARSFLVAGAGSVLASGWVVDDRANLVLMSLYYEKARLEASPRKALRAAQLEMMQRGRSGLAYVHPFFWAGMVQIGGI